MLPRGTRRSRTLAKKIGGGIYCPFQIPDTHEEDPIRDHNDETTIERTNNNELKDDK